MANILILEDDLDIRKLFDRILRRNHNVWDAATAKEADTIASQHHFDLALVDIVLPGGRSGTEFALSLIQARPKVRVLFVSGLPIHGWRVSDRNNLELLPARYFTVLEKPFLPSVLQERVLELLSAPLTRTA